MSERFGRYALNDVADALILAARRDLGYTDAEIIMEMARGAESMNESHERTLFVATLRRMQKGSA